MHKSMHIHNTYKCTYICLYLPSVKIIPIVHFKRLGSRVSHDSFNQYVLFFSKQCTYCKTNAIYT